MPSADVPDAAAKPDPATTSQEAWGLDGPSLGLSLGGAHTADQLAEHAAWVDRAESLGMHSIWLPEMHFARGVCPAPLVELAGYAATTRRVRLGTTSLLLPLHPPEAIAAEIASLDQLSGGRALIGLGRGFQRPMLEAFGVEPATKRDRFDQALERILTLWGDAQTGRADRSLRPRQQPHPPLAVAAFGPKGLAQAAHHGLPYLASPVETFDQIADNQARHRALLPARRPEALSLVMRTIFVSEDADELAAAREALAREMVGRRKGMPAAVDRALDAPLEARARGGRPPVVLARLVTEQQRLGLDLLVVRPQIGGLPRAALERSLDGLVRVLWPELRRAARDRLSRPRPLPA